VGKQSANTSNTVIELLVKNYAKILKVEVLRKCQQFWSRHLNSQTN